MAAENTTAQTPEKLCLCAAYELEIGSDAETMQYADTGCASTTTRDFAPGHDAKLKSLLIRAGIEDRSVRYNQGGVAHIGTAEEAAARLSFGYMVLNGIKKGEEKLAQRSRKLEAEARGYALRVTNKGAERGIFGSETERDAFYLETLANKRAELGLRDGAPDNQIPAIKAAAPKKAAAAQTPAKIKVGRWEYQAMLDDRTQAATYTDGKGKTKTVEAGRYQVIFQNAAQ